MKNERLKRFILIAKDRFLGAEVGSTSALISYYLLLSLFPLAIAVGSVLSSLHIDPAMVLAFLDTIVPEAIMSVLSPIILSLLTGGSGGLLSVGLIAAIWSTSRGVNYLQRGLNRAYGLTGKPNFIVKRLVSLVTIVLIILLLLAFALVFGFGENILHGLSPAFSWAEELIHTLADLKWPVTVGFLFCMLLIVYCVTPDVKVRLRDTLPGTALATIGLLILVQAFTLYLRFTTRSFSSYGVIGAFLLLMLWLNFSAIIVLVGAVLNASIGEYRFGKATRLESGIDRAVSNAGRALLARLSRLFRGRGQKKK